jgi:chromosome segregation ATPase
LGVINQHIMTAQDEMERAHRRLGELTQRLEGIRRETAEQYRRLAKFRLDELAANQLITRLDDTRGAILKLLERRTQAFHQLESEIEQTMRSQESLAKDREEELKRRDDLLEQIENRAAAIKERLGRETAYMVREQRVKDAVERAQRADEKAGQAEEDRARKGKPYEEDPLFMYLWNRRYLTPDYSAGGLVRRLDGWVARLIDYTDARGNYYMLTELPVRLREHADRQKQVAEQEMQALRDIEAKAMQADGIPEVQLQLEGIQKGLEQMDDRIEAEEKRHEAFLQRRAEYSSGDDEFSLQAIQLQVAELKNDSVANLYRTAQATPKPDDDVIVTRIRELQDKETQMLVEMESLKQVERRNQEAHRELEDLRRRFRRNHYDANHSYFPGGFDLAALLALLMAGRTRGDDVWERIGRGQRFRRPRVPEDFGGGIFGRGGFGKSPGGFGGGFGGGGFRTGGRF